MHFRKLTLIGVGLLGGSLGLAVKRRRLAGEVAGFVRRRASLSECVRHRAVDGATLDLPGAVQNADLVVLCTPLAQMRSLVKQMLPALKPGVIVTDVGSAKAGVVRQLEALVATAGGHFIGSHPMAGAEKTGVAAARVDLFEAAVCVLTPTRRTNPAALRKLERFWRGVGCRVLKLPAETHDRLVSRSSHLPHVVAAALAASVLDPRQPKAQGLLCATGFRDTTRIASGSPEMWRDIVLANRVALRVALDEFVRELQVVQGLLRKQRKNADKILEFFATAKARRDAWRAGCVSPSPE